jgi:hypothetical protein
MITSINAHLNINLPLPIPPLPMVTDIIGYPFPAAPKEDTYIKRLTEEEQKKNRDELLARKDDLIFISPMLMGYALKNKLWREFKSISQHVAAQ